MDSKTAVKHMISEISERLSMMEVLNSKEGVPHQD
jgi:hypothetical protein